jgi:hypothetical protein
VDATFGCGIGQVVPAGAIGNFNFVVQANLIGVNPQLEQSVPGFPQPCHSGAARRFMRAEPGIGFMAG